MTYGTYKDGDFVRAELKEGRVYAGRIKNCHSPLTVLEDERGFIGYSGPAQFNIETVNGNTITLAPRELESLMHATPPTKLREPANQQI